MSKNVYDVVIVGGGMVGACLGCALGGSGLKVAVLEESPPNPFEPSQTHDLRVSALSLASTSILKTIGAWSGIVQRRFCPFRRMRVWEGSGNVEFRSDDIAEPALGFIVENRIIQWALLDRLAAFENVKLYLSDKPVHVEYAPAQSSVTLESGITLTARLLVAADGGHSKTRQSAGLGVSGWDYPQHALVMTVDTGYGQQDITWQQFTPRGPLAFLPLDGPHASLVWYETPDRVKQLRSLQTHDLLREVEKCFPSCLGSIDQISAVGSFPLRRQHALSYAKEGIALAGDAAHMIHPLAGQGVNIGLLDAAALAEVLIEAHNQGRDIGSLAVLGRYESLCRHNNLIMMTTMDMFFRVFGNTNPPLRWLRNAGLEWAERINPAKKAAMRYAVGIGGHLPRLARGEALVG
ncbi:MAG: UbiH/UbiF/VisC/COQ6 family ubiquinone biosynthesis hydroxylase [Methylococcaceae bacterium]